jgi:DNA-binding MarR family transcriptional regulator
MKKPEEPSASAIDAANQLHGSALRLFRALRAARQGEGLTLSKAGVLGYLYRGGVATSTELAAYLRVKPQSLTRMLADLEKGKLIARRLNGEDRRENLLEITEAGAKLLIEDIRGQRARLAHAIERELTGAEKELLRIAAGLMDRIAEKTKDSDVRREGKSKTKKT